MEEKKLAGRYRLLKRIGRGGMSRVYKARDELLDRDVAVKVMYEHLMEDDEFVYRFLQEAKALAKISHPNFVQIHDVGQEGTTYYMVMELMSGPTLWQELSRKRILEPEEAIPIMIQVLRGIGRAHNLGIIHRDIKPTNIMYSADGRWKLMDLGASKLLSSFSELTKAGMVIGTAQYYSPEQAKGEDARIPSDLYSMGIVLFQILTGRLPFVGKESFSIALKHVNEPIPDPKRLNPNLPDELCEILYKALAKNPQDRYQSAYEMIEALEEVEKKLQLAEEEEMEEEIIEDEEESDEEESNSSDTSWDEEKSNEDEALEEESDEESQTEVIHIQSNENTSLKQSGKVKRFLLLSGLYIVLTFIFIYIILLITGDPDLSEPLNREQESTQNLLEQSIANIDKMNGVHLEVDETRTLGKKEINQQTDIVLQTNYIFAKYKGSETAELIEGGKCYKGKINEDSWNLSSNCGLKIYKHYHPQELLSKIKSYIQKTKYEEQDNQYVIHLNLNENDSFYSFVENFWEMQEIKPSALKSGTLKAKLIIDKTDFKIKEIDMEIMAKHDQDSWLTGWFQDIKFPEVQAKSYIRLIGEGSIQPK
ncbi:protein kinase domain-containing protein [Thermoflavimicrobium daqui]|uniref:Serine/threonine-protein kinase PrkC n=1 Tax=Thermoflavimicrobium daqui TaxID=2137476 RepID=A0A364K569_9BACL|nr:protein kinase [Thermoflavimicrobium daqui]RAL24421.1 hypothetical protein DL897_08840 [Thermoflavimicrobium daqui]